MGEADGEGTGHRQHAMLWNGTNVAIDLNPTNIADALDSCAYDTNGHQQVGYGLIHTISHALLWNGTSEAIDLHELLGPSFLSSTAYSVDDAGTVYGIAKDGAGNLHAIEWTVPEPASGALLGAGALMIWRRRRKKGL